MEAGPEQLSRCAAAAEQFTSQGGVRTRVIGWYHSHPHITVLPSHVDIKTQATYQMLDDGFVGLIFSTFNQVSCRRSFALLCEVSSSLDTCSVLGALVDVLCLCEPV